LANKRHLNILRGGVKTWNKWREEHPKIQPALSGAELNNARLGFANLRGANLREAMLLGANLGGANLNRADLLGTSLDGAHLGEANLFKANLVGAHVNEANLRKAILRGVNLSQADLRGADLVRANLSEANLSEANLSEANLSEANLRGANLPNADLRRAALVKTDLREAVLDGCSIFGVSAWQLNLAGAEQKNLIVTEVGEPTITVDYLEVAQFIYLMLNNTKIRNLINTITSKGVLILGRFADPQHKAVLYGLREKLREFDLVPMVFDFDRPTDKDYTETIQTLAGMSMFVIADVTSPKSTPLELEATVKQFKIPYVPIIDGGAKKAERRRAPGAARQSCRQVKPCPREHGRKWGIAFVERT
jgi:uncharacterized protein YjbI with pentapeptide repeats